jgi:hypothetical protein
MGGYAHAHAAARRLEKDRLACPSAADSHFDPIARECPLEQRQMEP